MFLSYVAVAAIIVLSLLPGTARPQTGAPGQGEHVVAYLLTAFLFGLRCTSFSQIFRVSIILVVGAGILEATQQWVPGRNSQVGDFIASSVGILMGSIIGGVLSPLYCKGLLMRLK